jgi:hypothetical protein
VQTKTTVFNCNSFDIIIEEAHHIDAHGRHLWYLADVYVRDKGGQRHLVRKSRLPETVDEIRLLIKRDGMRVTDQFRARRVHSGSYPRDLK